MNEVSLKHFYCNHSIYPSKGILFLPKEIKFQKVGIFTHGYTSSISSILSWGIKGAQKGIPIILFNLPGHFLGHDVKVRSFEEFILASPDLFLNSYQSCEEFFPKKYAPTKKAMATKNPKV